MKTQRLCSIFGSSSRAEEMPDVALGGIEEPFLAILWEALTRVDVPSTRNFSMLEHSKLHEKTDLRAHPL